MKLPIQMDQLTFKRCSFFIHICCNSLHTTHQVNGKTVWVLECSSVITCSVGSMSCVTFLSPYITKHQSHAEGIMRNYIIITMTGHQVCFVTRKQFYTSVWYHGLHLRNPRWPNTCTIWQVADISKRLWYSTFLRTHMPRLISSL